MQHVVLFEDDVVHWMLDFLRRRGLLQSMRALEREANVCTLAGITQEGLYLRSLVLDGKWSALHRALDVLLPPLSPFSSSSTSTPASPARNTRSGGRTQPPTVSPEAARQLRFLVKRQEYIELLAFDPATDDELPEAIKGKVLAIQQQQHQQKQQQQQAGGNTATHDAAHRHGVGGGGGGGGGHDGRGGGGISNPQRAGVVSPALNAMMMANGQAGGVTTTGAGAPISNGHAGSSGGGSGGGVITEGHLVISKALLTAVLALLAEMKQLCTDQAEFASLCQLLTHERLTDVPSYRTWTRAGSRLNLFDRVHGILGPMLGMPPPAVAPPPSSSSGTPAAGNGAAHDTTAPLFPPDYLDTLLGLGLIRLKRELKGVSDAYVEVRRRDVGGVGGGGGRRGDAGQGVMTQQHQRQREGDQQRGETRVPGGVGDSYDDGDHGRGDGGDAARRREGRGHGERGVGGSSHDDGGVVVVADLLPFASQNRKHIDDGGAGHDSHASNAHHHHQQQQQQHGRQVATRRERPQSSSKHHRHGADGDNNNRHHHQQEQEQQHHQQQQQPQQQDHHQQQQQQRPRSGGVRGAPGTTTATTTTAAATVGAAPHQVGSRYNVDMTPTHTRGGRAAGGRDDDVIVAETPVAQMLAGNRGGARTAKGDGEGLRFGGAPVTAGDRGGGDDAGARSPTGVRMRVADDGSVVAAPMTSTPRRGRRRRTGHHGDGDGDGDGGGGGHDQSAVLTPQQQHQYRHVGDSGGVNAPPSWDGDGQQSIGLQRREPCPPRFQRQLVGVVEDQLAVRSLSFHPHLPYVAVGANSQTLRLCSTHAFQDNPPMGDGSVPALPVMLQLKRHHRGSIYSLAWSGDGTMLASGSNDKTAHIMRFDGERCELHSHWDIRPHDGTVRDLCFSQREPLLLTAGAGDCSIAGHDFEQCTTVFKYKGHTDQVSAVSNRGDLVLSASLDSTVRLWDMRQDMCIRTITCKGIPATSAAVNPDASHFAVGLETGVAMLFDLRTGKELKQWVPHQSDCRSVEFSHDAHTVLTGSYDGTARLTAMDDHPHYTPFTSGIVAKHNDKLIQARWHPTLPLIGTTSADHTARFWYLWL